MRIDHFAISSVNTKLSFPNYVVVSKNWKILNLLETCPKSISYFWNIRISFISCMTHSQWEILFFRKKILYKVDSVRRDEIYKNDRTDECQGRKKKNIRTNRCRETHVVTWRTMMEFKVNRFLWTKTVRYCKYSTGSRLVFVLDLYRLYPESLFWIWARLDNRKENSIFFSELNLYYSSFNPWQ